MKRICSFPPIIKANPYLKLFYSALLEHNYCYAGGLYVNDKWLISNKGLCDILHFHWPENIWRLRSPNRLGKLRGVVGFWRYLRLAHKLNKKIWWTLHNLEHHEGADFIDRLGYNVLAKNSDVIICHSNYAANIFKRQYNFEGKVVIMYHGTYEGVYPNPEPKEKTCLKVGLNPQKPIFSCLGMIRDYKGFDIALKAMKYFNDDIQLIIAGEIHPQSFFYNVFYSISDKKNIFLIPQFLSDQEFSNLMSISDAIVLPYRKITTSGLFLAAITFLKPIIAVEHPYFKEIVSDCKNAAFFFSPLREMELSGAIKRFLQTDREEVLSDLKELKKRFSWNNCIKNFINSIE